MADYFGLTFPPYEYKAYPKWITLSDGKRVIAETEADERTLTEFSGHALKPYVAPKPTLNTDKVDVTAGPLPALKGEEKAVLFQIAEERGVKIDKRWSPQKIRAAIEAKE